MQNEIAAEQEAQTSGVAVNSAESTQQIPAGALPIIWNFTCTGFTPFKILKHPDMDIFALSTTFGTFTNGPDGTPQECGVVFNIPAQTADLLYRDLYEKLEIIRKTAPQKG